MKDIDNSIIKQTEDLVKSKFQYEGSGHDWWHILRVRNLAVKIAIEENADKFTVELAALLHDIADHKLWEKPEEGIELAEQWLRQTDTKNQEDIIYIIRNISFKGSHVEENRLPLEGKIVQDADRLDALGAIGIARAFSYGGSKGRLIYDPGIPPVKHHSFTEYKNSKAPTINHFYEKLLLLKKRLHTQTARQMAQERHQFMVSFLDQFYKEWNF